MNRNDDDLELGPANEGAHFGPIFACAARDIIVERALAGDERALVVLIRSCPADLPTRVVVAYRDAELRSFGARLLKPERKLAIRTVAKILVAAGRRRMAKRPGPIDDQRPFDVLEADERKDLEKVVDGLIALSPNWPQLTKMRAILIG